MQRLLIADTAVALASALEKQLKKSFEVKVCHDGIRAAELINSFVPDILVLDMMLPDLDGFSILYNLRASGKRIKVITVSRHYNSCDLVKLEKLEVDYILPKPYALSAMVMRIMDVAVQRQGGQENLCVEEELGNILLQLSFRLDMDRSKCVYYAILERLRKDTCYVTKELYPTVARICGGTTGRVEKAIRDAITDAFSNGNSAVWRLYFPSGKCPSNECFIGTMSVYLRKLCGMEQKVKKAQ